jgi:hypothetical protein
MYQYNYLSVNGFLPYFHQARAIIKRCAVRPSAADQLFVLTMQLQTDPLHLVTISVKIKPNIFPKDSIPAKCVNRKFYSGIFDKSHKFDQYNTMLVCLSGYEAVHFAHRHCEWRPVLRPFGDMRPLPWTGLWDQEQSVDNSVLT